MTGWMNKYNIPFNYNWDELFNDKGKFPLSKKALKGEKGVYTHNSVRTGKQDVFPQKELIDMFKSIATNQTPPPPANTIVWEILKSDSSTYSNGLYNFFTAVVRIKGTLNGESIEIEERGDFSDDPTDMFGGGTYSQSEALDQQIFTVKESIVIEGVDVDDNDWENAENTVSIG
tara:strand:- start:267 stop:788 length:522 start_codon:yes stop_codon:yes gene_type:complete